LKVLKIDEFYLGAIQRESGRSFVAVQRPKRHFLLRIDGEADISLSTIEAGWTELFAVADAVASGRLSAVFACERFGSASRGEKAYKADHALGLLLRTLHPCDTISSDDFRRETLRLLDRGEHVHVLQRQIRRAGFGSRRGRRQEELVAQSGSLTLLTNIVTAWNTARIQASVDQWRATNRRRTPIEALRHVSPAGFEHINFDGVFMFPVKQFRSRLLPSSAAAVVHTG
jgi:TnpA family transposase